MIGNIGTSELQKLVGEDKLALLSEILPSIDETPDAIHFQTNKNKLVQIITSFVESYFKKQIILKDVSIFFPQQFSRICVIHLILNVIGNKRI